MPRKKASFATRVKQYILSHTEPDCFTELRPARVIDRLLEDDRTHWDRIVRRFLSPDGEDSSEAQALYALLLDALEQEEMLTSDAEQPGIYAVCEKGKFEDRWMLVHPEAGIPLFLTDIFEAAALKIACSIVHNGEKGQRRFCLMGQDEEKGWIEIPYHKVGKTATKAKGRQRY